MRVCRIEPSGTVSPATSSLTAPAPHSSRCPSPSPVALPNVPSFAQTITAVHYSDPGVRRTILNPSSTIPSRCSLMPSWTGKVSGACRVPQRCITSLQISSTTNQQKITPDTCGAAHERLELPVIIAQPAHFDLISIVLIVSTPAPHGPVSEITNW